MRAIVGQGGRFAAVGVTSGRRSEIERLIDSGVHVVAVGWTQGTVNANGAGYRVPIVHVWKVRDGLVMQARFFIDNPAMLEALG